METEDKPTELEEMLAAGPSYNGGLFATDPTFASSRKKKDPKDTTLPRPVKVLEDRVLVRRDEAVSEIGSIMVPGAYRERPMAGTVCAIGPGRWDPFTGNVRPMTLEVGDRVLVSRYAGNEFKFSDFHDPDDYCVMRESEVLLVLGDVPEGEDAEGA